MSCRALLWSLLACVVSSPLHAASSLTAFEHFTLDAAIPDTFQTNTLYKISGVAGADTSLISLTWDLLPTNNTEEALFPITATASNRVFTSWLFFEKPGVYRFRVFSRSPGDSAAVYNTAKQEFTVTVTQNTGPPPAASEDFLNSYFGRLKFAQPVVQYTTTLKRPLLTLNLQGTRSKVTSIALSIDLEAGAVAPEFHDDGKNGDAQAADEIYSLQLPDCRVVDWFCIHYLVRPLLVSEGFGEYHAAVNVAYMDGKTDFFRTTLGLISAEIAPVSLERLSASVFKTDYLLNIVDASGGLLVGNPLGPNWNNVSKRVYEFLPDRFDFLFFRMQASRNDGYNGYYTPVQIAFTGTGRAPFDNSALYGSKGKLQAFQYVNFRSFTPQIHEMMHHWANQTPFLRAGDGSHWGVSNTNGVLGGDVDFSKVTSLGNDEYSVHSYQGSGSSFFGKYSKLELYMAGLVPASEVPPVTLLKNAERLRYVYDANGQVTSQVYRSTDGIKTYTIDDIIRELGPRTPAFGAAQTQFTAATVMLSTAPIDRLTATWLNLQMKHFSSNAQSDEAFAAATGFRATLDARLGEPLSGAWPLLGSVRNATGGSTPAGAAFSGGAAASNTANFANEFAATQPIDVMANLVPAPAHVGKSGRLYVLAVVDGRQFMQDASGRFIPFTGLANLVPQKIRTLESVEFISVANGLRGDVAGLVGKTVTIYVGYALDSAPQEIWHTGNPIQFTINR